MNLTPREIVKELNEYIIGQDEAKKLLLLLLEIGIEEVNYLKR